MRALSSITGPGLALWLAACAAPALAAQAGPLHEALGAPAALKLSGSHRLRYEALDGQFRPSGQSEDTVSLRTILTGEYDFGTVRVGAEMFDSRVYGAKPGGAITNNDVNALEVVQAYVVAAVADPFGRGGKATVEAGRFTLNIGSRRLVAADDYRNTTSSWTGLRFESADAKGLSTTVFYTLPQVRRPDDQPALLRNQVVFDRESLDLRFWGGAVAQRLGAHAQVDAAAYGLDERDAPRRPNRNRHLRTLSARMIREPEPSHFDFEAEAAYQFGSIRASTAPTAGRLDVSAGLVHLDAGYRAPGPWKLRVSVEYDWASGDHGGGSFNRFDTLYGMRAGDFGPSGIYAATGRANISSPGLRLEAAPGTRVEGLFTYRAMWLASKTDSFSTTNLRDPTGALGGYAGEQLDARIRYWLKPKVFRLDVNGAVLFKHGVLNHAPGAPRTGDTHYVALALNGFF
jgi:hypothetical protein